MKNKIEKLIKYYEKAAKANKISLDYYKDWTEKDCINFGKLICCNSIIRELKKLLKEGEEENKL